MTLITMLIIVGIVLVIMLYHTDKRIFVFSKYAISPESIDSFVTLHFVHGKVPEFKKEERLAFFFLSFIKTSLLRAKENNLGGRAVMQIERHVYGFEMKDTHKWMHIVPNGHREHFNGQFFKKTFLSWLDETVGYNTTSIKVPVTADEKKTLVEIYTNYIDKVPYDYAFIGMGSASALYEVIAKAGMVFPQESNVRYALNAFYPKAFRERVLAWARYNNFDITTKSAEAKI